MGKTMFSDFLRIGLLLLISYPCFPASEKLMDDQSKNKSVHLPEYTLNADKEALLPVNISEKNTGTAGKNNRGSENAAPVNPSNSITGKDGQNPDSSESAAVLPEPEPDFLWKGGGWLSKNGLGPINSQPAPKAPYYIDANNSAHSGGYDFSDQLKDEIRTEMGEDVYTKMAWVYGEFKSVDNLIHSTMSQYGIEGNGGQKGNVMDAAGQLNAMLFFPRDKNAAAARGEWSNSGDGGFGKGREINNGTVLADDKLYAVLDGQVKEQRFSVILQYLTIINLLYFLSATLLIGLIVKGFVFIVRQR